MSKECSRCGAEQIPWSEYGSRYDTYFVCGTVHSVDIHVMSGFARIGIECDKRVNQQEDERDCYDRYNGVFKE